MVEMKPREDYPNDTEFLKAKLVWIEENRENFFYYTSAESKSRIESKLKRKGVHFVFK